MESHRAFERFGFSKQHLDTNDARAGIDKPLPKTPATIDRYADQFQNSLPRVFRPLNFGPTRTPLAGHTIRWIERPSGKSGGKVMGVLSANHRMPRLVQCVRPKFFVRIGECPPTCPRFIGLR